MRISETVERLFPFVRLLDLVTARFDEIPERPAKIRIVSFKAENDIQILGYPERRCDLFQYDGASRAADENVTVRKRLECTSKNSSPFSINILFQFTQGDFHTFVAMMLKRQSKGNVVYFSLAGQQWGAYPYL